MIESGIPKLDDYLEGGIPAGKSLVYYIHPGVEGDVFSMQTVYHNLGNGHRSVYITSTASPTTVRERFEELGWPLDRFADQFAIVDAYSALIGMDSDERYMVSDPENIESINEQVVKAIEDFSGGVIACESLSTIMDLCGEETTLEYAENWNKHVMLNDCVGIHNFTNWSYSDDTSRRVKDELFNAIVRIGGIAERVIFGQYYGVMRVDWTAVKEAAVLFKILKPGGVKVYLPKILITGPFDAGKSTFVHALSTRAVSVDRVGTTIALDHGRIDYKGFSADIFGTPGQERFDPILKMLGGQAMGVFLIVDSTKPNEFARAKTMLELTRTFGLPSVVAANKQDMPDALSVEEIRNRMKLPESIAIMPVVATERKGVFEAFEELINGIMGEL